jgi:P27 family predicted phage terminase small subunit
MPPGLLTAFDARDFEEYVRAVDEVDRAHARLAEEGEVQELPPSTKTVTKPDGTVIETTRYRGRIHNPWLKVREDAFKRMVRMEVELGFPPTSRTRIGLRATAASRASANRFAGHQAS